MKPTTVLPDDPALPGLRAIRAVGVAGAMLALGFDVIRAEPKRDIDTFDDLTAVAEACPHLRVAGLAALTSPAGAVA